MPPVLSANGIWDWETKPHNKTGMLPLPTALGDLGFDYSYIMAATADRVPCVFIENGQVANYDPSAPIEVSYTHNFPGEPTGKDNPELLYNLKPSNGHNMSIVNGISRIGFMKGGGKALWKDENIADSITAHAVSFIEQHKDEPFFHVLCHQRCACPPLPTRPFPRKEPDGTARRRHRAIRLDRRPTAGGTRTDRIGREHTDYPVERQRTGSGRRL